MIRMENKRIKIKIFFRNMIYIVFILAIGISQVRYATGPVIMPDEVGYWSAGATLAGRDWSGVMSMSPYYGYGYGFILCIIIRLFSAPLNMYRCALILNIFFLVIIFIVSYHIIKFLNNNIYAF